jgi:hypothetical protein
LFFVETSLTREVASFAEMKAHFSSYMKKCEQGPNSINAFRSCDPFGDRRSRFVQRLADDIHQSRATVAESFLERIAELARLGDSPAL